MGSDPALAPAPICTGRRTPPTLPEVIDSQLACAQALIGLLEDERGAITENDIEALETVWRERTGEEKRLLQGLILAAASLVHLAKQHGDVAWRMMDDARSRLEDQPADYYGWNIETFRNHLRNCIAQREWSHIEV